MSDSELDLDLDELSSAEDFLEYFGIHYDASVVQVNRLHILQRFHDYLWRLGALPDDDQERRGVYAYWLLQAYQYFVSSNAQTEKVFRVFHRNEPPQVEVSISDLMGQVVPGAS